jgi:hypothetical protein
MSGVDFFGACLTGHGAFGGYLARQYEFELPLLGRSEDAVRTTRRPRDPCHVPGPPRRGRFDGAVLRGPRRLCLIRSTARRRSRLGASASSPDLDKRARPLGSIGSRLPRTTEGRPPCTDRRPRRTLRCSLVVRQTRVAHARGCPQAQASDKRLWRVGARRGCGCGGWRGGRRRGGGRARGRPGGGSFVRRACGGRRPCCRAG